MSQERVMIDTVKNHFAKDLEGTCRAYMNLSGRVNEDANMHSPRLAVDAATLAIFDIAYGEFKLGRDNAGAAIMCQDGQKRIDTAAQNGFDVRNLQVEEDKLKAQLPPCEISGGS